MDQTTLNEATPEPEKKKRGRKPKDATLEIAETREARVAPKGRQWVERLDLPLAESELATLATDIDKAIETVENIEEEKKHAMASFKAKAELAEAHVRELRESARTKKRKGDVHVIERFVFETNTVLTVRTDTEEIISERAMDLEERQPELFARAPSGETVARDTGEFVEPAMHVHEYANGEAHTDLQPPPIDASGDDCEIAAPQEILDNDAGDGDGEEHGF